MYKGLRYVLKSSSTRETEDASWGTRGNGERESDGGFTRVVIVFALSGLIWNDSSFEVWPA